MIFLFVMFLYCICYLISGNLCMITGGANLGRVGVVTHRERHPGSFDIIYIKDTLGHSFNTRFVLACVLLLVRVCGC